MTESLSTFDTGPYLQAALFCEQVLDEKDNVKSVIRIVDRLVVQATGPDAPGQMPEIRHQLVGLLSFKSGEAIGPVPIKVTITSPSGLTSQIPVWHGTVNFEGGTRGYNLTMRIQTLFKNQGPYWFNVYVGDRLATRMPFEVIYTITRTVG